MVALWTRISASKGFWSNAGLHVTMSAMLEEMCLESCDGSTACQDSLGGSSISGTSASSTYVNDVPDKKA